MLLPYNEVRQFDDLRLSPKVDERFRPLRHWESSTDLRDVRYIFFLAIGESIPMFDEPFNHRVKPNVRCGRSPSNRLVIPKELHRCLQPIL